VIFSESKWHIYKNYQFVEVELSALLSDVLNIWAMCLGPQIVYPGWGIRQFLQTNSRIVS